jgi:hypothetical protein
LSSLAACLFPVLRNPAFLLILLYITPPFETKK